MAIPHSTTGSLGPAFASARLVGLTVSLAYIHVLVTRLPTGLSQTSHSSVTLWEDTAPVKLTGCQCPSPRSWVSRLVFPVFKGGVSLATRFTPKGKGQSLPLTLSIETENTVTAYSKGA